MGLEIIEKIISDEVKEVIGTIPVNSEENLIAFVSEQNKNLVDLLYVFEALEKRLGVSVAKVVEKKDYTVMSIRKLAEAVAEVYCEIQVV